MSVSGEQLSQEFIVASRIVHRTVKAGYYKIEDTLEFVSKLQGINIERFEEVLRKAHQHYYDERASHKERALMNAAATVKIQVKSTELGEVRDILSGSSAFEKDQVLAEKKNVPYKARSQSKSIGTIVPSSMAYETEAALAKVEAERGDLDEYVRDQLCYDTIEDVHDCFSGEQVDALALAVYNIEKGKAIIVGDQAGIGKGRVAAGIIRHAHKKLGLKPIFITQKASLFSDFYRDLKDIGYDHIKPFIFNNTSSAGGKVEITEEYDNPLSDTGKSVRVLHTSYGGEKKKKYINRSRVPEADDFTMVTYSQFTGGAFSAKRTWLRNVAEDNVLVLDESHTASGEKIKRTMAEKLRKKAPPVGQYFKGMIHKPKGAVFLSATFAKRAGNMPMYAKKTAISDVDMTEDELMTAIQRGGVAMQEILASELVREGQMIRRERSMEGVEINYIQIGGRDDSKEEVKIKEAQLSTMDVITSILRDIIRFQSNFVKDRIEAMGERAKYTSVSSKSFGIINQALFGIKAKEVAEHAVNVLKEDKKVIVAVSNTMEAAYKKFGMGDEVPLDFKLMLENALSSSLNYSYAEEGELVRRPHRLDLGELYGSGADTYMGLLNRIRNTDIGITGSPIDTVRERLEKEGYSVREITGRKINIDSTDKPGVGKIVKRVHTDSNTNINSFNNGETDVIILNESGATGASMHSSSTFLDQRQRVMLVMQSELNIAVEVQKRGRTNRTGQVNLPAYHYMTSSVPAENRVLMMLKKKLASLDANATSNSNQSSEAIFNHIDFVNDYGDIIVARYFIENTDMISKVGDILGLRPMISQIDKGKFTQKEVEVKMEGSGAAEKIVKRMTLMATDIQERFYTEVSENYNDYIDYLDKIGENKLKSDYYPLEAETKARMVIQVGKKTGSAFGEDTYLETVKARVLRKPMSAMQIKSRISDKLGELNPKEYSDDLKKNFVDYYVNQYNNRLKEIELARGSKMERQMNRPSVLKAEGDDKKRLIKEIETSVNDYYNELISNASDKVKHVKRYSGVFDFFCPGRVVKVSYGSVHIYDDEIPTPGIFIGYDIDKKRKNPYAPSGVILHFAVLDMRRHVKVPLTQMGYINLIRESSTMTSKEMEEITDTWDESDSQLDTESRFIVTGNVLQGFRDIWATGRLISYNTNYGEIKKGIIMPHSFDITGEITSVVNVKDVIPQILEAPVLTTIDCAESILSIRKFPHYCVVELDSGKKSQTRKYRHDKVLEGFGRNGKWVAKFHNKPRIEFNNSELGPVLQRLADEHQLRVLVDPRKIKLSNEENVVISEKEMI